MATYHSKERSPSPTISGIDPSECGLIRINQHNLHWERYGNPQAPCVFLLHHGLGSIHSWRRQVPDFVNAGWQVLAHDRWGYGRSDERPEFNHAYLDDDAQEAFTLMDMLGIEKIALVGHSDGGSIALLMAAEQPERINAMVVVAAHIYIEPMMVDGLDLIAQSMSDPILMKGLAREHGERTPRLLQAWVDHWRGADSQSLSMSDLLPTIVCPTLVVQGELDEHATSQHAMDIVENVQQGYLWLIPGVKHMPPHEIPEVFNQRVLQFLADSAA
jgi:pimeloyl-ACP methyl ester carboxylesterase